jgi:DNA repair protein RadC
MVTCDTTTPARPNRKSVPDLVLPCQKPADGTLHLYAKSGDAYNRVPDHTVIECARRLVEAKFCVHATQVVNVVQVVQFLTLHIGPRDQEVFAAMHLTTDRRFIAYEELARGNATTTTVETRRVLESVLDSRASAIVIAHNHPQGSCKPSTADVDITYRLFRLLGMIGVELVDHIIIGKEMFSFAEHNYLNECWLRAHAQC